MSQGFRCCKIAPSQNSSRLLHVNLVNWNCKWGKILPVTEIKPDRRGMWSVLKTILKICGSWSSFMLPPDLSSWVLDMITCWSQGYWKKRYACIYCDVLFCYFMWRLPGYFENVRDFDDWIKLVWRTYIFVPVWRPWTFTNKVYLAVRGRVKHMNENYTKSMCFA